MARYFIGLLPPPGLQDQVNSVKQDFADRFASRKAQNSPPHITLFPPFVWPPEQETALESVLAAFAQSWASPSIHLDGFGAFVPRVIYVRVINSPELHRLQQALMVRLEKALGLVDLKTKHRPFKPHMTVAFRDLTKQNFHAGWAEYQHKPFSDEFIASDLTLLLHNGRFWEVQSEFAFAKPEGEPDASGKTYPSCP